MTAFDLTDSIHGIHRRLVAQLKERRQLPHPTIKGDEGELLWLKVLSAHLPRRYAVRRGIVIDSRGARSDAIDLIVYDPQYTPVFLAQDEHAYVFAEAVYAVFEVKYELTAKHVKYAAAKAASVRRLHRTNAEIYHAGGVISKPRTPFVPLGGLLTLSHSWAAGSLEVQVRDKVRTRARQRALDMVLCLEGGLYESGLAPGEAGTFEAGPTSFVLFLYSLLHRLQRLGTVPAIDWTEYMRHVRALQRAGAGR